MYSNLFAYWSSQELLTLAVATILVVLALFYVAVMWSQAVSRANRYHRWYSRIATEQFELEQIIREHGWENHGPTLAAQLNGGLLSHLQHQTEIARVLGMSDDQIAPLNRADFSDSDWKLLSEAPRPGSVWLHRNGIEYDFLFVANANSRNWTNYCPMAVYRDANGAIWTRRLDDWDRSLTEVLVADEDEIAQRINLLVPAGATHYRTIGAGAPVWCKVTPEGQFSMPFNCANPHWTPTNYPTAGLRRREGLTYDIPTLLSLAPRING